MKIVYISTKISDSGGTAKITALKANHFIEQWGFEVSIISTNDETEIPFYRFDPRIKFYFLKSKITNLFAVIPYYKQVQKIVKEVAPHVIIVNDNGFKAYFAPLFLSNQILWFEIHGSRKFLFKSKKNILENTFISWVSNRLSKKFDTIILLNSASKVEWQHPKIVVIPNFIALTNDTAVAKDSKEIIAIGRISKEKGYDRMLTVFQKMALDFPDWSLHIYGKIDDRDLYDTLLDRKVEKVCFHGETTDISTSISKAAFMIHTSYNEGMPMALLEVLGSGKTLIAFDVDFGVKDIIDDQYNGFLIKDGDLEGFEKSIRLLIQDTKRRSELEARSRDSIKSYSVTVVLEKWKALFQTL